MVYGVMRQMEGTEMQYAFLSYSKPQICSDVYKLQAADSSF